MKKTVRIGNIEIGGANRVAVQSMANTDTRDAETTLCQINELALAGCDIVRLAVYNNDCLEPFAGIVSRSPIPVVADIHFDYRLAIGAIRAGAAKVRINPGNIGSEDRIKEVAAAARDFGVPIRVGANSGSINKDFERKYGRSSIAVAESALDNVAALERVGFDNIVISAKSSNVREMIEIYRYIDKKCDYPLHLGVTEAGDIMAGTVKSSIGIGVLLLEGIGNTIRVSLTAPPVKEVNTAFELLRAVGLYSGGVEIISCPTCARCKCDIEGAVAKLRTLFASEKRSLTVAVMGCVVNGPGEASHADIGVAGGDGKMLLFEKGEKLEVLPQNEAIDKLYTLAQKILNDREGKN